MSAILFFRIVALILMVITARTFWREYGKADYERYTQAQNLVDSLEALNLQQARPSHFPSTVQRPQMLALSPCPYCRIKHDERYPRQPEDCYKT